MYTLDTYDVIAEAERELLENYLKLESVHPADIINNRAEVLHEAVITKLQISKTLDAIVEAIKAAIKKFRDITRQLKTKNDEWMVNAQKFDLNKADLQNFREEIFPYWIAIPQRFNLIKIPQFTMVDAELYTDQKEFMNKYFKTIVGENGDVNKNLLRGLNANSKREKLPIEYGKVKSIYRDIIRTIGEIIKLRDKVAREMNIIAETVKSVKNMNSPMNESILLNCSIFKDEYFDILLEGAFTPEQAEKEAEQKENGRSINIKPDDNDRSSEVDRMYKAVTAWSKLCSAVTTAEMDILDEAYSECAKFIDKVMKAK